ncbi:MAG: helix-turn-helix transcriptional regulator [Bacteroidales bacterium]
MGAIPDPVEVLAESLAGIQDRQPREQAFLEQIARLGVGRFAYVNTTQPSQPVHLETNYAPEWVGRYLSHNYAAIDPVSREAQRTRLLFQWRAALAMPAHDSPQARQLFAEAAEFGLHDGLCVPIHAAAGISTMSLAVDDRDLFKPKAARLRQTLHLLALHYHLACERALAGAEPAPPPPAKPLPRLTPREREVLLWTAKGKTGWEIAQILRLAERTVVYHVENAKTKLGASSRSQAVVMALGMGLIDP